jgi:hypothetical protein
MRRGFTMPRSSTAPSTRGSRRHRHRPRTHRAAGAVADLWLRISTARRRHPGLAVVVAVDALITYAACLAAYALVPRILISPPPPYSPPDPWVYVYGVPVAATAAWLGGSQVLAAWAHDPRWWRLMLECAGIGALATFLIVSPDARHPLTGPVAEAVAAATVTCLILGAVLTPTNYVLSRALRPRRHRRRRRSRPDTLPDTPPAAAPPSEPRSGTG